MRFTLERVSGPELEPVTLAEMKLHLREFTSVTANDATINALIVAAREWAEDYTGRALIDQTWRLTIDASVIGGDVVSGFQGPNFGTGAPASRYEWLGWMRRSEIMLHKAPVLALLSFKSVDDAGVETDVPAASYALREATSKWPRVVALNGATWVVGYGGLRLTYRAGFSDQTFSPQQGLDVVPERFKQAIKLWVEANYDRDPNQMDKLLATAELLIKSERVELQLA